MEWYFLGGVLGLLAAGFGLAAARDWNQWRRPWWVLLCALSGPLSLGAIAVGVAVGIWSKAATPPYCWWQVLALAAAGGLLWSARHVKLRNILFDPSKDLATKSAFDAAATAGKQDPADMLDDPEVLEQLVLCPESRGWVLPIAIVRLSVEKLIELGGRLGCDDLITAAFSRVGRSWAKVPPDRRARLKEQNTPRAQEVLSAIEPYLKRDAEEPPPKVRLFPDDSKGESQRRCRALRDGGHPKATGGHPSRDALSLA